MDLVGDYLLGHTGPSSMWGSGNCLLCPYTPWSVCCCPPPYPPLHPWPMGCLYIYILPDGSLPLGDMERIFMLPDNSTYRSTQGHLLLSNGFSYNCYADSRLFLKPPGDPFCKRPGVCQKISAVTPECCPPTLVHFFMHHTDSLLQLAFNTRLWR